MRTTSRLAAVASALALALTPAAALAAGSSSQHPPASANAYGKRCQNASKHHVKGQKGTAFSRCVTAAAHAQKS